MVFLKWFMSKATENNASQKNSTKSKILGDVVSINDLRDKEFSGEHLNMEEKTALFNFDKFRLAELSQQKSEKDFHNKYIQLQVMANLSPYQEFLKEKYR
jgi:hypothetical protein